MAFIKIVNAEGGSDARYDVNAATPEERRQLDPEGRPLSSTLPGQWEWTPGLPGARGGSGPGFFEGGGGGGGGAGGGDLYGMAVNSPYYQQALAATQASGAADAAARRSAIQQALVRFGLIPEGFQDKYGDVDDTTRNLAAQNTQTGVSAYARLQQALKDAQRASSRNLTAKGLRRSGARGYQMRRNQLGYDQAFSDAISQLLGGINESYKGFAQGEYGRSMNLAQALQSAIGNLSIGYTPSRSQSFGSAPSFSWGSSSIPGTSSGRQQAPAGHPDFGVVFNNGMPTFGSSQVSINTPRDFLKF